MGRGADNDVILSTRLASRDHAELRPDGGRLDAPRRREHQRHRGERAARRSHRVRPGDEIAIGDEVFRLEEVARPTVPPNDPHDRMPRVGPPVLRVTVSGGGPSAWPSPCCSTT